MVFLQLLSISITLLRIVNVRLKRTGGRIGEKRSVIALHRHYLSADSEHRSKKTGERIWEKEVEE